MPVESEFEWSGEFTWDSRKDELNRQKHGLPLRAGMALFASDVIAVEKHEDRYNEPRFVRIGRARSRILVVVWARDGYAVRLISVREATKHEREAWHIRLARGY